MNYTTKNNKVIEFKESNSNTSFKVNLPRTIEDQASGNGEGIWASCSESEYNHAIENKNSIILCKAKNDSVYFPNLKYDNLILVEFVDGENIRPVAPLDELKHTYGEPISDEERQRVIDKIIKLRELQMLFPKFSDEEILKIYNNLYE